MLWMMLLACPGPNDKDTEDSAVDTADTQDTSDTQDTAPEIEPDLGFAMDGDWEGTTLALVPLQFGDEAPELGDAWQSWVPDAADYGVEAGDPPAEHLFEVDAQNLPGVELAIYVVVLFEDTDGSGAHEDGERILGVGPQWAVWANQTPPDGFVEGMTEGWNGYIPAPDGPGTASDPLAIPAPANLSPREELTFGGENTLDTDQALNVALIPGVSFEGGEVESLLFDGALGATWEISLSGPPPSDHFQELEGIGNGAFEAVIAYADEGDGSFGAGDAPVATACKDGKGLILVWVPELVTMQAAWQFGAGGLGTGWVALLQNGESEGPEVLAEADLGSLVIDEDCSLGD